MGTGNEMWRDRKRSDGRSMMFTFKGTGCAKEKTGKRKDLNSSVQPGTKGLWIRGALNLDTCCRAHPDVLRYYQAARLETSDTLIRA